uniref:Uncharacterized protein n=1 Tax=Daphnia galeata TaxID=27404 RepID=A0A8J2WJ66_9CRUS|nr:unnamed protein product [Daphnia galeata]
MEHNDSEEGVITIDLSPLYQEFNKEIAHENYFRWRHEEHQFNYKHQTTSVIIRVETHPDKWSNIKHPIDITGRPSVHRILLMRDITKRLRDLDDARELDKKLFSTNSSVEIYFKLEDTEFSLNLIPRPNQPGNAVLTMTGAECGIFKDTHKAIEDFECFRKLDAMTIDSIVTRARQRGKRIREEDIDTIIEENEIKKRMAEQLTFFMLIYDFEIARRLQRPYVNKSENYDSLPIGIGIAFNHLINKKRGNHYRWVFFSYLFIPKPASRKEFLEEIIAEFKKWDDKVDEKHWTRETLIRLLDEHFGGAVGDNRAT